MLRAPRRTTWPQRGLAVLVAVLLVAGGGVLYIRSLDRATPFTTETALDEYRRGVGAVRTPDAVGGFTPSAPSTTVAATEEESQAGSASSRTSTTITTSVTSAGAASAERGRRAPGVYTFETTGWETVDAVGVARHDYPELTTYTIWDDVCGQRMRWAPLNERWDEVTTCFADGGEAMHRFVTFHEFFGQADRQTYECEPRSWILPPSLAPGTTWDATCETDGTVQRGVGQVIGVETLEVQGQPVETVHVRFESELTGNTNGTGTTDTWSRLADGLLIRQESTSKSHSNSAFGGVNYREEYTLHLASLEPQT